MLSVKTFRYFLFYLTLAAFAFVFTTSPFDLFPSPVQAEETAVTKPKLDVHFVPTPPEVVDAMLKMAKVTENDVVYDLGCGDGRIVIAAAKQYGARGVGVDLDPQRIREARRNAEEAGVANRVTFVEGNLFEMDLSDATVVTLYLLSELNLKLRPKLLRELKPGSRVVSHNFSMGDWEPQEESQISTSRIYYWVIPDEPERQEQP